MHSTTLRTRDARLIATGRNRDFPKLFETHAGLRWIGRANRIAAALEAVERGAERECVA